ncbi:MAG: gamma-glutamyltransferase family protein [Myxococcota bacterium]
MLESQRARLGSPARSERSCVLARRGMVATSVPVASAAGVEMLRRGGNAIDAAIAAAAVLSVVEPMQTGVGGDAFALFWSAREGRLVGLNGSGRAPASATLAAYRERGLETIEPRGILAVSVPGAVHAWETLRERYGSLDLATLLEPAIRAAEEGFAVTELVAHFWWGLHRMGALRNAPARETFAPTDATPAAGAWFRNPRLAASLRVIAKGGSDAFYRGELAEQLVATSRAEGGCLEAADLAGHTSTWVEPIAARYRDVTVAELPPNGQGVTALLALNVLGCFEAAPVHSAVAWHRRIEAVKLAMADRNAHLGDPDHVAVPVDALLSAEYARERAALLGERALATPAAGTGLGDTTFLCTADAEGNQVAFIQSLFTGFGSGIACGDTGILLQSRGAGFRLDPQHPSALAPGKRPFHTLMPGFLLCDGAPWMAFGIMGGDVQAQAHTAFVSHLVDGGMNPQEALDAPRFRWQAGARVVVEQPERALEEGGTLGEALAARGHEVLPPPPVAADVFGGGQAIAREGELWIGASDRRKDGCALGLFE